VLPVKSCYARHCSDVDANEAAAERVADSLGALLLSSIDTAINVMDLDAHYMQVIRGGLMLQALLLDSAETTIQRKFLL